jgi:serine/threonine protein kinase
MAEVFRAYQESLDRDVAIKIMHSFLADEENFLTRFQREARAMASLNHSNIVSVYDFDVQEGIYYIVMEFVSGGTLKEQLENLAKRGEKMEMTDTVRIVLEVGDALAYAHSRQMVHRDIKPGNIMINEEGHAILTDFGIAKILSGPSFTATGAMIGTPAYMSPEQGLGQAGDERSDLYALGVLFYQMSTGRLPYDADTPLAVILKHVNEPIPEPLILNEDLPPELSAVIVKAMAKDPEKRYQTAAEFATDLQNAATEADLAIGVGFSFAYLSDKPTPTPSTIAATSGEAASTMLSSTPPVSAPPADKTRVAVAGAVGATDAAPPIVQPPPIEEKKRPIGWIIAAIIVVILLIGGAAGGFLLIRGGGEDDPTPTAALAIVPEDTDTPKPTDTPSPTKEPAATIDIGGTAVAAVASTLTAAPTQTPEPTTTDVPTETTTPDVTATFLATCEQDITLLNAYTFQNTRTNNVPIGAPFPMNLVIENSGTCPVQEELFLVYMDGEEFSQSGPVPLGVDLAPGDEATVVIDLRAPNNTGLFDSTWQWENSEGESFGSPISFEVTTYVPQTPTPRPTATPDVPPTPVEAFQYRVFVDSASCAYAGLDWTCNLIVQPFGGIGPYRFVSDEEPPADFSGAGPFTHPILRPRCRPWVQTVTVIDDGTGQVLQGAEFISPDPWFPPDGCTTSEG